MFIAEAPIVIVVCADLEKISLRYGERGKNLYSIQDTANATFAILLSAHSLGLGSCWVGAFDEERVKSILELPDRLRPVAILPIGYPAEKPPEPRKIPFENLTWTEKYGRKYEISFATQPPTHEVFEPLGYYIKKAIERYKKARKEKKKGFLDFLKLKK